MREFLSCLHYAWDTFATELFHYPKLMHYSVFDLTTQAVYI